ncbi:MlaD family protein [Candidatus Magnetaquicoccus inordinatus]|uniref:MlaD family protein n=1 Tax=Candidatus Magnetaquicoccus inordinatus TaxID=2496818 RepID=UPI00102B295E|nr:MlaD family protein [Candidatus Magnetaquicoccus inordinatus]
MSDLLSWRNRDRRFKQSVTLFIFISMLLVLGMIWLGHTTDNPFDAKYNLHSELAHGETLKIDTPVTLAGILIGRITNLQFTSENKIRITIRVLKKHMQRIRADSVLTLVKPMVGNASLDISLGSPSHAILQPEQQIAFGRGSDLTDMLSQLPAILEHVEKVAANIRNLTSQLLEVQGPFQQTLSQANATLSETSQLGRTVNQKGPNLQHTIDHLESLARDASGLMQQLRQTTPPMMNGLQQSANRSLQQVDQTVAEMHTLLKQLHPLIGQVQGVLRHTDQIAMDIAKVTAQLGQISPEIPVLLYQGQETMREAETLMHNVNHSILFGSSTLSDPAQGRLSETPRDLPMLPVAAP